MAVPGDAASELPGEVVEWLDTPRYELQAESDVSASNVYSLCAAVEDANPVWWEESAAREILGDHYVPPATLSNWTRPELWAPGREAEVKPLQLHYDLKALFDYPTALVSSFESVFYTPVVVGDRLRSCQMLRSVSAEKQTRLGCGRFWVIEVQYHNQRDELAGTEQFNCFGYHRGGER